MKTRYITIAVTILSLVSLFPGEPLVAAETASGTADAELDEIHALFRPGRSEVAGTAPVALTRQEMVARLKHAAEKARTFRQKHTRNPKALAAKQLEARALLNAALIGEESLEEEAIAAAEEVGRDSRVPIAERFQLATLRELVRTQKWKSDQGKLRLERERSAKRLIEDFPEASGGYEALLREAENHPDATKALALAREVLLSRAPPTVKVAAQVLVERHALIGQKLHKIAAEALGVDNPFVNASGRVTIVYTWATWSPGAVALAKRLPELAPSAVLVGVCLDSDLSAARALASSEALPGELIFDERGIHSPLVEALKLSSTMPIYVADRNGEIRDVAAERGDMALKQISDVR